MPMADPAPIWRKRLFWFVGLYLAGAAAALALAYGLRALLPHP